MQSNPHQEHLIQDPNILLYGDKVHRLVIISTSFMTHDGTIQTSGNTSPTLHITPHGHGICNTTNQPCMQDHQDQCNNKEEHNCNAKEQDQCNPSPQHRTSPTQKNQTSSTPYCQERTYPPPEISKEDDKSPKKYPQCLEGGK